MNDEPGTMHRYYSAQQVLPTYARFDTARDLRAYEQQKRAIFIHKLGLPPRVFQNARLLEFGPDSGENSLVYAHWGAFCTLSEPNLKAHPFVREYFNRFGLAERLFDLKSETVAEFGERYVDGKYDIVVAEGFIHTVKPDSLWMGLCARLLEEQGYLIISYVEAFGSFLEFLLKVIYKRVRELTAWDSMDTARKVFTAKWNSIPHTRAFESWIMDNLENPFGRLHFFLEPRSLCEQMHGVGLSLYSSWPPYEDGLSVDWVKKPWNADEQLAAQVRFISQSRLSHFLGRQCFLTKANPELEALLWDSLVLIDGLIDKFEPGRSAVCRDHLDTISTAVRLEEVVTVDTDRTALVGCMASAKQILFLLEEGDVEALIAFCNSDRDFISSWGSPAHYAVFSPIEKLA